jgi:hypothetical protein
VRNSRDVINLLKEEVKNEVKIKSELKKELQTLRSSMEAGKGYLQRKLSVK